MTRAIAIISCLVATLFLVPIQGDCNESPEYELETEIECCIVVNSVLQPQVAEKQPRLLRTSDAVRRHAHVSVKRQRHIINLPARILNCVFRE